MPTAQSNQPLWHFHGRAVPLIGRAKPLHSLRELVRSAAESQRCLTALLTGPLGIGKSRLLQHFTATLPEHVGHARSVHLACRPDLSGPAQIFARFLRARFEVPPSLPRGPTRQLLQQALSGLLGEGTHAQTLSDTICDFIGLSAPQRGSEPTLSPADELILTSLAELLRLDGRQRPLVIAIDNLHLASADFLTFLTRLSARIQNAAVVFVCTARSQKQPALAQFSAQLQPPNLQIELPTLSDREAERLLNSLLSPVGAPLPEGYLRSTLEKALGNPLALEQIVQLQIDRGVIEIRGDRWLIHDRHLDDTRISESPHERVRQKLSALSQIERGLLEKASVIGEVFYLDCLQSLHRAQIDPEWWQIDEQWDLESPDALEEPLESLQSQHLVQRLVDPPLAGTQAYVFRHSIEREVIYADLDDTQRALLHRQVARWLSARAQAGQESPTEWIAEHWAKGGDPRLAAQAYLEAGERAMARHANPDAAHYFALALEAFPAEQRQDRAQAYGALGRAQVFLGQYPQAQKNFQEFLRLAWQLNDLRAAGLAYTGLGRASRGLAAYSEAQRHFKRALLFFRRVEDLRGLASVADELGRIYRIQGRLDRAEERIREALRLRTFIKDERSMAVSLHQLGNLYTEHGQFKKAAQRYREALNMARRQEDQRTVADILTSTGQICYYRGQYERAITVWREALPLATGVGDRRQQGRLYTHLGAALLRLDRLDESQEQLEAASALLDALGDRHGLCAAWLFQAQLFLQLSELDRAQRRAEQALERATALGAPTLAGLAHRCLGQVCSRTLYADQEGQGQSRIQAAQAHFLQADQALRAAGNLSEQAQTHLLFGAFLAEIGRATPARTHLQRAATLFTQLEHRTALERTERILSAL